MAVGFSLRSRRRGLCGGFVDLSSGLVAGNPCHDCNWRFDPLEIPEVETTPEEETTTEEPTTPEQDRTTVITISYTSGASVANVLVESANPIDPTFVVSWKMTETNAYKVVQLNDTTWMIKVDVPANYSSKLRVKVYDADGTMLEIAEKQIKN